MITMMATMPATKNDLSSDLENVSQGRHLQKALYLSYYTTESFYQTFIEMMAVWPATKISDSRYPD